MDRLDPKYLNAVRYLYDRINYEKNIDRPYDKRTYRLARMEYLLAQMGNPHLAAPVIHVAGTKGKGSVSWLIAETLRRSGKKVGLYTSPHLLHIEERFVVNGAACLPSELANEVDKLKQAAEATAKTEQGAPTFFEMTTALAWSLFASQNTDVNVIEVGLGGRLDSTNVCSSSLAIITSISFDHQQQLGNTIELITTEKAGIIKPHVPVISGATHPDARSVIRQRCQELDCELWELGVQFEASIQANSIYAHRDSKNVHACASQLSFRMLDKSVPQLELSQLGLKMPGRHQADNAAVAIAAWHRLNQLGWQLPKSALVDALEHTSLSCRIEVVSSDPHIVVDTSHNIASIEALLNTLREHFVPSKRTIVFACSKDKEFEAMLGQILNYADRVILTQFHTNPRAVLVERLEELAKARQQEFPNVEILSAPNSELAVEYASKSAEPNELICITGSFFLASETFPLFSQSKRKAT